MNRREFTAAGLAGLAVPCRAADVSPSASMGLLFYSYNRRAAAEKAQGFADPAKFLAFAKSRGANAIQISLGTRSDGEARAIRQAAESLQMHVEGIVTPPRDERADLDRFRAELATAHHAGVTVVRTVMHGGRRYEVFEKPGDYDAFAKRAEAVLRIAEPVAREHKVVLAIENHKDFRVQEQVDLLKKCSSEWLGVCLDTGNNIALLEEPLAVVEALAPFTRTVHLKDMAFEDAPDGFRMTEVPLGQGTLDLPAMVKVVRKVNPKALFQLEMITRDPLSIPCLGEKYWASMAKVPGLELARTLSRVRQSARKTPLPRLSTMSPAEQIAIEDRHVRESFSHASKIGL